MLVNFTALSAAGVQGPIGFLKAPFCLLLQASQDGALQGFLIPASIIGCVFAVWYRRYSVYHGSLLFSLLILLVIYSDKGSDYNHLLDLVVLSVPVVAHLWVLLYSFDRRVPGFRVAFTCSIIWAGVSSWSNTLAAPFRLAVESMRHDQVEGKRPGKPLVRLIDDDETILSEDPWVVVSRGQVPYILDPYALARLTENRPTLTSGLLCRVRSEEFGKVVLLREADGQRTDDGVEWYQRHLGPELIHAICIHYRLVAQAEGYYVYAPRGEPEKSQSEQASR